MACDSLAGEETAQIIIALDFPKKLRKLYKEGPRSSWKTAKHFVNVRYC